jgi:hypothetical protein
VMAIAGWLQVVVLQVISVSLLPHLVSLKTGMKAIVTCRCFAN